MSNGPIVVAIVFLVFLAFVPAEIAQAKGRSFWIWYFLGLILVFPAVAGALAIEEVDASERVVEPGPDRRRCPFCAATIESETAMCPGCDRDVGPVAPEPAEAWSPETDQAADQAWRAIEIGR